MAVTGYTHGQATRVWVDGYEVTTYLNTSNTPTNREEHETTTYGAGGNKLYQPGNWDGTVELGGFWKQTTLEPIQTVLNAAATATVAPAGAALNAPARVAAVVGTKDENPSDAGDIIGESATLRAQTGIGRGRIIRAPGAGDNGFHVGDVADFGAASSGHWQSNIHLTSIDAGTFTGSLKHSVDNVTWVAVSDFPALTARGGTHLEGVGTLYRYRRLDWNLDTGTAVEFMAALASR